MESESERIEKPPEKLLKSAMGDKAAAVKGGGPADSIHPTAADPPIEGNTYALLVAFVGEGYRGWQYNPKLGSNTLEGALREAVGKAWGTSEETHKRVSKAKWSRAARTDKGVSATGQVVSLRMLGKPGGTVKDLNGHLPDHIRVWVCIHAARHFNAHRLCDLRKYEYVFPTWILDQWRCRERAFYAQNGTTSKDSHPEYIFDSDLLDRLNSLLGQYEGSHSFHNFTVRAEAEGTTVTRDILHCGTCGVIDMQGEQFVRVSIVGRSFMLHQIRKMVGLVIAMARYIAPEFCLKAALAPQNVMAVPVAPEVGLMLVECVYDEYNKQNNHACISLQQFQDEALVFKDKLIYPSIARRTRDLKVFENWLPTVNDNAFKFSTWNRSGGALPNGSSRA